MNYFKGFQNNSMSPIAKGTFFLKYCYQLILGIVLLTSLPLKPAQAQQYVPPSGKPPQTATGSNGSRSNCDANYNLPLVGLAPTLTNHVGQTTTTTPTFAWFVPTTQSYHIRFSLYSIDQEDILYETNYEDSLSGIISFSVPADVGLEPGERYLWEVNISCDVDSPTYEAFFISEFDIVSPTANLSAALALAQTSLEKASLYAEAGYWYDALQEALATPDGVGSVQTLISNLATTEEDVQQRQYLSQVVEIIDDLEI